MTTHAATLRRLFRRRAERLLAPRPLLTVSEWAAQHRQLSREASAEPGRWDNSRNPAMVEPMDAMGSPLVETVVLKAAAQCGKTEAVLNVLGYMIDTCPGPALVVLPTLELGRAWALERFAPMTRDSAVLRHRVSDPRSKVSEATILSRRFPGGSLTITGANAAASLSSRPCRWVICDETDRFPLSVGAEGSPIQLAFKRSQAWPNRKLLLMSSPTLKGVSVIEEWYERGDQRTYHVPCPDCGTLAPLTFERLHWEKDADGNHQPATAALSCADCGALITERQKPALLAAGRWVPAFPERAIRSYHLPALASPFVRWEEIVREFLEAKADAARLQVWTNTTLGLAFADEPRASVAEHELAHRLEAYPAEVPAGVAVLTAGVDVQDSYLAVSIVGWGAGEEAWLIQHEELLGSPSDGAVWAQLDQLLRRQWTHELGAMLQVRVAAIDTGGHHTSDVYRFVAPRQARPVAKLLALKGHRTPNYSHLLGRPSLVNRFHVKLYPYGSAIAKDAFFSRLRKETPGPGYVHLPDSVSREYLNQLLAERVIFRKVQGRPERRWEKFRKRSEALDCFLYALIALQSVDRKTREHLGELVPRADAPAPAAPAPAEARPTVKGITPWQAAALRGPRRSSWLNAW